MSVLEVKNLEKHFDKTKVLNDISFTLEQGQALSIIGSSGSGKTTLLQMPQLPRDAGQRQHQRERRSPL